ncbi:TetR/AcrR family transcriptional regulator [Phytohabitans rumicis]|uniref:TetR family transcriptional regulator n=1 Tax=Phytohabitans rumicis TaxID=1076125 RepID=A0A6V8LMB5_9ACTN|nr:TetR/AcrR family transcriptional regulator [Phytohabitans rumicis]GFJ95316.1 TetR family transcriptional regulator [Phytohabitans rumicis]
MSTAQRAAPRRERARAATINEIKQTALSLMRAHGPDAVKFTDIARAMDMTPPALYRYFADRDALISALIADAYEALGARVAEARAAAPPGDIKAAWLAAGQAYRHWAREEPQQFTLILGLPLPDYAAPKDGATSEAAGRAMAQLSALFVEAIQRGELRPPLIRDVHPTVEACALVKSGKHDTPPIPAESFQAMLHGWAALHGFTCLEAYGHFDWMDEEARDQLFLGQLKLVAVAAGLPY